MAKGRERGMTITTLFISPSWTSSPWTGTTGQRGSSFSSCSSGHSVFYSSEPLKNYKTSKGRSPCALTTTTMCVGAEEGTKVVRTEEEIERLFSRLTHVNKNMRKKASNSLSEIANDDDIDRLIGLLSIEDVHHRRQAVQTLGMIGVSVVPKLLPLLNDPIGQTSTVRASCAKAMAAISLYYPEDREMFSVEALNGLKQTLFNDPDPVTRISVVGCLGSLGCDQGNEENKNHGNQMAYQILKDICSDKNGLIRDLAVSATATSALAQIAQNGTPELKEEVISVLQSLSFEEKGDREGGDAQAKEDEDEEEDDDAFGLKYVEEIAAGHLEQLLPGGQTIPQAET